ncbi:hypothetical protein [Blastopirellula marina]|uniref:Uncharacterized protein n=1 Tax=Blastopirellula marina TaxID=124 RepID=A0A2S8GCU4_9BACT|nr:hypothetical protein [Blastopirellula marina]PQO42292.1 hypothetical protein C5Y93_28540 [Blastopirellula marina]
MGQSEPEERNAQCEIWGWRARVSIGLIAIGMVILMLCVWYWSPDITRAMLVQRGIDDDQAKLLKNQAPWGDSYGATNALFSGIALVAAVTAVAFQVIELGGQRQEIRLQLKEMEKSNATNEERLTFDRATQEYHRRKDIFNLMREMEQPPLRDDIGKLHKLMFVASFETYLADAIRKEQPPLPSRERSVHQYNEMSSKFEAMTGALAVVAVFEYLHRVHLLECSDKELANFAPFILAQRHRLNRVLEITRSKDASSKPAWAYTVPELIQRCCQFSTSKVIEQLFASTGESEDS